MANNQNEQRNLVEVKYKNEINGLNFRSLKPGELNVAMSIFSTLKNQEHREVELSFSRFRELSNLPTKDFSNQKIRPLIESTFTKLGSGNIIINTEKTFTMFPMFDKLHIDVVTGKITYRISEMFMEYFNFFLKEYVSFPLIEFINLKSKYAKNLYRLLMQYKNTGMYRKNYNNFLYKELGVLESIPRKKCNNQIVSPAVKELQQLGCFNELTYSFVKNGKEITDIIFNFRVIKPNPINIQNINDEDLRESIRLSEEAKQRELEETIRIAKEPWLDDD